MSMRPRRRSLALTCELVPAVRGASAVPRRAVAAAPASDYSAAPNGRIWALGPSRTLKTLAEASHLARDGERIEVDAGDNSGDVTVWSQHGLRLRAVGGRVQLLAAGAAAEGKVIWVVRAQGVEVEGFDFSGCRVAHRNGAGIRLEAEWLVVRDCRFLHNEMGLLTANGPVTVLEVQRSEFANNQRPDGHSHKLYAGTIASFTLRGRWPHHGHIGHRLKSRAADNHMLYNRLDGGEGSASYALEFPESGRARVPGNLLRQGRHAQNLQLVSCGAEGRRWPDNQLLMANNTHIDDIGQGTLLILAGGAAHAELVNNLWVGSDCLDLNPAAAARMHNNVTLIAADFAPGPGHDARLLPSSAAFDRAVDADPLSQPTLEYGHPWHSLALSGPVRHAGAFQSTARP